MVMVMIMTMIMTVASRRRAAHLGQCLGKSAIRAIKSCHRFLDQVGNISKPFVTRRCRPFDKFRLMAAIVLNPMGQ